MQAHTFKTFDESVYEHTLNGRLKTLFIPKKGFAKTFVMLKAPIGSNHRHYHDGVQTHAIPAGAAHFLEHKVFEKDGEDLSQAFALHDAQINAYTSPYETVYYFQCTRHLMTNIQMLSSMFFLPRFTDEGIEREKGIILEELNMRGDDPYQKQYYALLKMLFKDHPVTEEIIGTKESIQAMTKEILEAVHEAYYAAENAVLIIVGDHEPEALFNTLEKDIVLGHPTDKSPWVPVESDALIPFEGTQTKTGDVSVPSLMLALKLPLQESDNFLKEQLNYTFLFNLLFSSSSEHYHAWLNAGVVTDSYQVDVSVLNAPAYALIATDSHQPDAFIQQFFEELEHLETWLDEAAFERMKKSYMGNFIKSLDSLEGLANRLARYLDYGYLLFDVWDVMDTIDFASIQRRVSLLKKREHWAVHQLLPQG